VRWTDDHCHLDLDDAHELVADARRAGVERMITVGTDLDTSRTAIEAAGRFEGVWATVGVHPHEARYGIDGIDELFAHPEVVAVGECGLDYHYDHSPRPTQREVFCAQVEMAHQLDLPLVVHTRSAWDDTFSILEDQGAPSGTILHCFSGGPAEAERALELGAYLSFSGIVTFRSAGDVRAAAAICPLDRLLIETDSPYLAPVPHRGERNRPALVPLVGEMIAEIRGCLADDVAELTWSNADHVYGLTERSTPSTSTE
jgi:TatD DNase family protein